MQRYKILAAAALIEILLGFQYTWGIFDRILQDTYHLPATFTQRVFSFQVMCFAFGMVFAGRIMQRTSPRLTTLIGGIIYGCGLSIAGLGGGNPYVLSLCGGAMVGLGIAFAYMGPLVVVVAWFPRYKGIATGLVVGAFGSGALFLGSLARILLARGFTVFGVFLVFGLTALVGVAVLSTFMREPSMPDAAQRRERQRIPEGLLRTPLFWSLVVGLFAGTFTGLAIVGSLEKIGQTLGSPERFYKAAVLVLAIGNASGRAGWGVLIEVFGTKRAVISCLLLQTVFVTALIFAGHLGPALIILSFLVGFNYGGTFVLYVTEVARTYGPDRVAGVYGLVYLVYVVSGFLAPGAAGMSYVRFGSYVPSLSAAAAVSFLGAAGFALLYRKAAPAAL